MEDDFLHKVLYVTVLRAAHEHHPVVGEALHGGFFPHLGAVPQLQLHLHGTLRAAGGETAVNNRKATVRHCTLRLTFFFLLLETHIKGNGGALCIHVYARGRAHPTPYPARGAPGPASTPAGVVTECYPQSGRGSGDRGKERENTQPLHARQQMHRKQIRRQLGDDAGAVSQRGKGDSRDPRGVRTSPLPESTAATGTRRGSLCVRVCVRACGALCQAKWKLQAASADGHKLPCSYHGVRAQQK